MKHVKDNKQHPQQQQSTPPSTSKQIVRANRISQSEIQPPNKCGSRVEAKEPKL